MSGGDPMGSVGPIGRVGPVGGVGGQILAGIVALLAIAVGIAWMAITGSAALRRDQQQLMESTLPVLYEAALLARQSGQMAAGAGQLATADQQATRASIAMRVRDEFQTLDRMARHLATIRPLQLPGLSADLIAALNRDRAELLANFDWFDAAVERRIDIEDAERHAANALRRLDAAARGRGDPVEGVLTLAQGAILETWPDRIETLRAAAAEQWQRVSTSGLPAADAAALADLVVGPRSVFALRSEGLGLRRRQRGLLAQNETLARRHVAAASDLYEAVVEQVGRFNDGLNAGSLARSRRLALLVAVALAVAAAAVLVVRIRVVRRLRRLQQLMSDHVAGRRTPIATDGRDEIAEMARAFRYFVAAVDQREAGLVQARDAAQAAARAKAQFLATMSHELRTPLNSIIGFSEMMTEELFGPLGAQRYRDYAQGIRDSGCHLLELIDDVLDMAKIDAGKYVIRRLPLDLTPVVADCLRLVAGRAEEAGIGLEPPAPGRWTIAADRRAVRQILLNLLSNAIKFTPAGGRIRVGIEAEAGHVAVVVADTGIGIPEDKLALVTEPFEQAHSGYSAAQGTGLGLSITKSLVELHGGRLDIRSREGAGTVVTVMLPAAAPARSDPALQL